MTIPFNTARAYIEAGNLNAARKIAREAMEKNPDNVAVHDLMVDIALAARRYEEAVTLCRDALARWPDHSGLRLSNALALMHTGRGGDSAKAIENFEEDFPHRSLDATLLNTIWQTRYGSLKRARYYRRRFEEMAPDSPHVAMLDAMIAGKADDLLGRERASKRMAEDAPMDAEAHARLAYAQFDMFHLAAARRSARAALAAEPTKRQVEAILWLSWMVLLPPFLLAHAYVWIDGLRNSLLPRWAAVLVHIPLALTVGILIVFWLLPMFVPQGAPAGTGIVLILMFMGWPYVRMGMLRWFGRRTEKPQDISLKGY